MNPTPKKLLFLMRQTPYGSSLAKEAIDAVLATSVYEQELSVLFIGDGVFQLLKEQQAQLIGTKNISSMLAAFPLYDINQLFVCGDSLKERGITANAIPNNIDIVDRNAITEMLHQQDHLLSF